MKTVSQMDLLKNVAAPCTAEARMINLKQGNMVMWWQAQVASLGVQLDDVRQRVPAEMAAQLAQALQHCRPLLFATPGATVSTAAPTCPGKVRLPGLVLAKQ